MDKSTIRRLFQNKRNELSLPEKQAFDQIIADKTIQLIQQKVLGTIHIYLPREQSNEIDTWPIIKWIWAQKGSVCCPYIVPGTSEMEHYELQESDTTIKNKWGIPEPDPTTTTKCDPANISAVVVPLLAFDKNGYRVGYGGGFYDRFLPLCNPGAIKIGLSYFDPINEIVDKNLHDVPLDLCITPNQIYSWT